MSFSCTRFIETRQNGSQIAEFSHETFCIFLLHIAGLSSAKLTPPNKTLAVLQRHKDYQKCKLVANDTFHIPYKPCGHSGIELILSPI